MKKGSLLLGVVALAALAACGKEGIKINPDKEEYVVGIAQFTPHPALDAATNGFKTKLTELLTKEGRKVKYHETNAAEEISNCATIVNSLISKDVDLILANATPCLTAAYTATSSIPILGTSVTDYASAGIDLEDGKTKQNVSGTSDYASIEVQINSLLELVPNVKKVGLLYSANEANSKFQVDEAKKYLAQKEITATEYAISEPSALTAQCNKAKTQEDAMFIPTDNFCAKNVEAIASAFAGSNVPIYAGEEGICKGCGFATCSIDYYHLGQLTGEMAYNVLLGKVDIREYPIQKDEDLTKLYVASRCEELGIKIPENAGYQELELPQPEPEDNKQ